MENEIYDLIGRLQKDEIDGLDVLKWAAPIASFGDPAISRIATLGLNPSDKEFTDNSGNELNGVNRRFHTLKSLNLKNWGETTPDQVSMIAQQCRDYFSRNPYDNWFKRLDFLISGTSLSYYFPSNEACHLDLVPFATGIKWAMLSTKQKKSLLSQYGDILGKLINASRIKVLVLNGRTVVNTLSQISDVDYRVTEQPTWKLQRTGDNYIAGFSYEGTIHRIGTIQLNNEITILGFNHNIQSSFGVTSSVQYQIRLWITEKSKQLL
ncbi:hypothetical protein [Pedobacter sp. D749]|uniref:hypothetical protein n=1 Tax=Pedobacter sp. D749 TaxID=2856523 RepID=UPI001C59E3C7|nr:hypothetical protein [Pedobacter sp. D749]QXU42144.1 hypothetical protein KYH19_00635 [Pedobacter sp. D749]